MANAENQASEVVETKAKAKRLTKAEKAALAAEAEAQQKTQEEQTNEVSEGLVFNRVLDIQPLSEPETDPPETDPPDTDPPETDPPDTDPPETDPPDTDPPETDPPDTDPPETDPPDTDPKLKFHQLSVKNSGKTSVCFVSGKTLHTEKQVIITYKSVAQKEKAVRNFKQLNALAGRKRFELGG